MKDMFIVGGFNAYPAEIEALLAIHPGGRAGRGGRRARRADGGGRATPSWCRWPGRSLSPAELVSWAREQMANFKVPRHVELVEALPLNASGKVLKYELRTRALASLEQT